MSMPVQASPRPERIRRHHRTSEPSEPSPDTTVEGELARLLRECAGAPAEPGMEPVGGTRVFGPRPPRPVTAPRRRGPRAALAIALPLVIAGAWLRPAGGRVAICQGSSLAVPPSAQVVRADTSGTGCLSIGVYVDQVLTIRVHPSDPSPRRIALGRPGDVIALDDWDCDGVATVALLHPATGEVTYFDSWTSTDQPRATSRCRSLR